MYSMYSMRKATSDFRFQAVLLTPLLLRESLVAQLGKKGLFMGL